MVTEQAAEAEQNLADVRAAFPVAVCKNCGGPLEYFADLEYLDMAWKHAHGFYGCDQIAPMHSNTHAEPAPPVVISSPAYFLPELKSDADHFAENYRLEHDLPFSMLPHLAWAWFDGSTGRAAEGMCAMKLSTQVMYALRQRRGLEEDDSSQDERIYLMPPQKMFDEFCDWHGLINWGPTLRGVWREVNSVSGKQDERLKGGK